MANNTDERTIDLNAFLKFNALASTGGKAKLLIRSGEVNVNGVVETRNGRKLRAGDVVTYQEKKYVVEESVLK